MNIKKMRVAIIGTGMIANSAHLPAYRHISDLVEVVACADIREDAARETAERYGIPKYYTDPQKMLDEVKPDLVSICTPNNYHKQWTIAALRAGANVVCEKPIAVKYQDALDMFDEAEKAGKFLFPCQTMRFSDNMMAAKNISETGRLGQVYFGDLSSIRRRGVPTWGMFHMKEHNAGGPFCDLGVHIIDSFLWIAGNPKFESVSGRTWTKIANTKEDIETSLVDSGAPGGTFTPRPYDYHEFNVEDFSAGTIKFENELLVNFKFSWAVNMPNSSGMIFSGTNAGMITNPLTVITNLDHYQTEIKPTVMRHADYGTAPFSGHKWLMEHIQDVLRNGVEPIIKKEEALNVVAVIEAFYLSSKLNHEVTSSEIIK